MALRAEVRALLAAAAITVAAVLLPPTAAAEPAVVDAARSAIGKPYVWAATGPNAFDCSGLVVWSYAQAGVAVPRTSQQQANSGIPVARADLEPGDVVVFYANASHVGIYEGGGMVIHAPAPGRPVVEVPIDAAGPYRTARRI
ncbi:C40 family peptidase [Mycobacterium sp. CSUR Q5927]|nr:C40 family peptidase [Mycobacterium sp. CSUR Q5927]